MGGNWISRCVLVLRATGHCLSKTKPTRRRTCDFRTLRPPSESPWRRRREAETTTDECPCEGAVQFCPGNCRPAPFPDLGNGHIHDTSTNGSGERWWT